jgi:hypothetical protein
MNMARFVSVNGLKVKLPKGASGLGSKQKAALGRLMSNPPKGGLRRTGTCPVIFFKKGALAVQRCEGRRLRAHNKRQCRNKKTKLFTRCK